MARADNNADWKYRFKENSDRMRTGSLLRSGRRPERAVGPASGKVPFFPGKEMLERARYLLVSEIGYVAKNCEDSEIEALLSEGSFEDVKLRLP